MTPKGFLWKLTLLNSVVIALAMGLTGWAIYETACKLVGGIGSPSATRQVQFNATLFQYFLIFTGLGVLISTVIHFYLTKKLIRPIRELVTSTKVLKEGNYPPPVQIQSSGEMEELINQYNELIVRLERNEQERKRLIENISHELRTPTSNIKGYLFALKEGDLVGDEPLFNSLHGQAEQLTELIEQVEGLNVWQEVDEQIHYEKELIDSKQLIEESIQLFDWKLKDEGIIVETNIEFAELKVHKNGMQQVLSNIIENAIRYRINHSIIEVIGKHKDSGYEITISSEGEPIPSDDQKRIFERFYRVDHSRNRATGGSGLGLAIAKEIVTNHNGTIQLETYNQVHTFTIFIPLKLE